MDYVAGEDVVLAVRYRGPTGDYVTPDLGSVRYTVRDNDGAVVDGQVDVLVTTDPLTVQSTLVIPAAANTLVGRFAYRTVVVSFSAGGVPHQTKLRYRITPWLNHTVQPAQVRSYFGVNTSELADDDIDLMEAYLQVETEIGDPALLETLLSSGDARQININNAILYRAALNVLPSIQLRLAQEEADGSKRYTRFARLDMTKLEQATMALYTQAMADATGIPTPAKTLFMLSTQSDPITGDENA